MFAIPTLYDFVPIYLYLNTALYHKQIRGGLEENGKM